MNPDKVLTWHCLQGQGLAPEREEPPAGAHLVRLGLQICEPVTINLMSSFQG